MAKQAKDSGGQLHNQARFDRLHDEWVDYQEKVEGDDGEQVTVEQHLSKEIGDVVDKELDKLKEQVSEKETTAAGRQITSGTLGAEYEKFRKSITDLAEKAYMAEHNIKKKPTKGNELRDFNQRVESYFLSIAQQSGEQYQTFDEAIETMAKRNVIHGKKESDRSKALDTLINAYASSSYESKDPRTKGKSLRRLRYVESEMKVTHHNGHMRNRYTDILKDAGYEKARFSTTANVAQVMQTVKGLHQTGKADVRASHIKATNYNQTGTPDLDAYLAKAGK